MIYLISVKNFLIQVKNGIKIAYKYKYQVLCIALALVIVSIGLIDTMTAGIVPTNTVEYVQGVTTNDKVMRELNDYVSSRTIEVMERDKDEYYRTSRIKAMMLINDELMSLTDIKPHKDYVLMQHAIVTSLSNTSL